MTARLRTVDVASIRERHETAFVTFLDAARYGRAVSTRSHQQVRNCECAREDDAMSSRIANIAIDAKDASRVAQFWCDVLGWEVLEVLAEV